MNYVKRLNVEIYLNEHIELNLRVKLGISKSKAEILMNNIITQVKSKYEGTIYGEFIKLKWNLKLSDESIQSLMHINQRTFYIMENKIINEVTLLAAKKRLVKPF